MPRNVHIWASRTYSTGETARKLHISVDAVTRLCIAGKLAAAKDNGRWRISGQAIRDRTKAKIARGSRSAA